MARLLDSDRLRYSLEVLTTDYLKRPKIPFKKLFPVPETALKEIRDSDNGGTKLDEDIESIDKDLIPEPFLLQINKKNRMKWIDYCVYDTEATWLLREKFESLLLKQHWGVCSTMYDLYKKVYVPFARLLVRMEERGFHIDVKGALSDSFENAFSIASKYADKFKKWAVKYEPNSENLNPRSYRQVQQLLFAPNSETDLHETKLKHDHIFNIENENNVILPGKKTPNKYLKVRIRVFKL
ncbi:hypothetical protein MHBO_001808 [Bonamia ostreae]|uniref:Uncharacterized protein n=1 Tax=Bonamia ostreae TaxID=126728 RepID=A0ABV2AK88_9EUKA